MFNAVLKIPMQFFILLLGAMIFVFYQFEKPPVFFNQSVWQAEARNDPGGKLGSLEQRFAAAHAEKQGRIQAWLEAKHSGNAGVEAEARRQAWEAEQRSEAVRTEAKTLMQQTRPLTEGKDSDYVFITFILDHLPHGVIGLLIAAFFAAALSSKAAELNALGSTTTVDFYQHVVKRGAEDAHYVTASKWFTALWGLVALAFALFASLKENLIQAVNIVGSWFYGVVLGLFLVAFFLKRVGGTAVFWATLAAQALVFFLHFAYKLSYLWYNPIGCIACVAFSLGLSFVIGAERKALEPQLDEAAT
jgi:Na+(H+)/acetate symporter ActP